MQTEKKKTTENLFEKVFLNDDMTELEKTVTALKVTVGSSFLAGVTGTLAVIGTVNHFKSN